MKKASMPKPVKRLGYTKCYSSISNRPIKNPSSSIRCNCKKTCSLSKRPEIIMKIRKKVTFLEVIKESIIYKFSKDFTNQRKEANILIDLRPLDTVDLFPTFLNKGSTDELFEQSGNQNSFRHILKSSL